MAVFLKVRGRDIISRVEAPDRETALAKFILRAGERCVSAASYNLDGAPLMVTEVKRCRYGCGREPIAGRGACWQCQDSRQEARKQKNDAAYALTKRTKSAEKHGMTLAQWDALTLTEKKRYAAQGPKSAQTREAIREGMLKVWGRKRITTGTHREKLRQAAIKSGHTKRQKRNANVPSSGAVPQGRER